VIPHVLEAGDRMAVPAQDIDPPQGRSLEEGDNLPSADEEPRDAK
jgi:hypothetical protein